MPKVPFEFIMYVRVFGAFFYHPPTQVRTFLIDNVGKNFNILNRQSTPRSYVILGLFGTSILGWRTSKSNVIVK